MTDIDPSHPGRSILRLVLPYWARLVVIALIFIVKDSPMWLIPILTARTIDIVIDGGPVSAIGWLALVAAIMLIQIYPMHLLWSKLYQGIVRQVGLTVRNTVTERLLTLSMGFHGRTSPATMQSKIVRDAENVETMFTQAGNAIGNATVVFAGAIVATAIMVPQFLPIYAATIPAGVFVWFILRRRTHHANTVFRMQIENYARHVGDMATLVPITRAHGLEDVAFAQVSREADRLRHYGLALDNVNAQYTAVSWIVMQLLALGCLFTSAAFAITSVLPISAGEVVLLGSYFTTLTGAVMTILSLMPMISRGRESMRSIGELMRDPDEEHNEGKPTVEEVLGGFHVEGLTIQFDDREHPALDGVDLEIAPGETVALVGASGAGKSTLVNALLGFVRPTAGRILLDGVDLHTVNLRSVRRHVSVVPQESVLIEASIRDNVTYGTKNVTDEALRRALEKANIWEVVQPLASGWDTLVGERGAKLSGGQRQRISIARALIRDPRVLILDEATSALDSESELKVHSALDRLMEGRTTIVIAHRLSTVQEADRIVVLDRGRIVEMGTHDELMGLHGRYSTLWDTQHRHG